MYSVIANIGYTVSDSQNLRPLAPGARAASPRKKLSVLCEKCAKRIFHTTHSIGRTPQARASERDGNRTDSGDGVSKRGRNACLIVLYSESERRRGIAPAVIGQYIPRSRVDTTSQWDNDARL